MTSPVTTDEGYDFAVTLTLRLSMNVYFGPPQETPPKHSDAIALAIARLVESGAIEAIEQNTSFEIAYPIDGEAEDA